MSAAQKHKVVLMGASSVGKTSIVIRFSKNSFTSGQESTIGAAFTSREVDTPQGPVSLHIWDTAGQELYRSLVPKYSHGAQAVIIVFDVTDEESFHDVNSWLNEARSVNGSGIIFVLVGNKCDLTPTFDLQKAEDFAEENGMIYLTASALTGENVDEIFTRIACKLPRMPSTRAGVSLTATSEKSNDKQCCG